MSTLFICLLFMAKYTIQDVVEVQDEETGSKTCIEGSLSPRNISLQDDKLHHQL